MPPKRTSRRTVASQSQWSPGERLAYHYAEVATHLAAIRQILPQSNHKDFTQELILKHVTMMGKTIILFHKMLERKHPEVLKQNPPLDKE